LCVLSFLKAVHYIDYSAEALQEIAAGVEDFAAAERLPAHRAAITVRRTR
jgi:histidinol dehydrogenase